MYTKSLFRLGLVVVMTLAFSSCKKDKLTDPVIPNEQEIITTLQFTLSPTGGGVDIVMSFIDMDGDGPLAPLVSVSDSLMANTQYTASLVLLNETVNPADSINSEILAEAEEHQFFFIPQGVDVNVAYDDSDLDGMPIGLSTILDTGAPSTGSLTIVLRHLPVKTATGVAQGDITNAGGETDIEASFDVVIE
jgi:hypothetical protein